MAANLGVITDNDLIVSIFLHGMPPLHGLGFAGFVTFMGFTCQYGGALSAQISVFNALGCLSHPLICWLSVPADKKI
jgi:hypothetical protein